ncbi:unnamed protein product [Ixodes pacificus]
MRAWYLDESSKTLTSKDLDELLNVKTYNASSTEDGERELQSLMQQLGWYKKWDQIMDPNISIDEKTLQAMGGEHRHPDMEVRYIKQGTCYFDVRDSQDRWVRIEVSAGDHIVLPPKIYHRFNPSMIKEVTVMCLIVPEGFTYTADFRET